MKENRMRNGIHDMLDGIELSGGEKQRILENCLQGRHVHNNLFRYSRPLAAALVIGVVSTSSLSVYAAVSAYQAYMEKMSSEEIQERYDNVQSGTRAADSFSRQLAESERSRMEELREAYQAGEQFPEHSMNCFDGTAENLKITGEEVIYDYAGGIFYLPERELTDEELLQIIDVWEKANYSIGVINDQLGVEEEDFAEGASPEESYVETVAGNEAEQMQQISRSVVQTLTGRDDLEGTWVITYRGVEDKRYLVQYSSDTENFGISYTEESTPENWTVYSYRSYNKAADMTDEQAAGCTQEELDAAVEQCAADAVRQLKDAFGVSTEVVKCEYSYRNDVLTGESSQLQIVVTTKTGDRYRFTYQLKTGQLEEMLTYENGAYDDIQLTGGFDVTGEIK